MFFLAWMLICAALGLFFWVALSLRSAPIVLSLMFFALIYCIRPAMIMLGANLVNPALFNDSAELGAFALIYAFLYLSAALVTVVILSAVRPGLGAGLFPEMSSRVDTVSALVAILLTIVAMGIGVQLFLKFGSLQAILFAAKITKDLAGTFGLRSLVGLGAFFSSVALLISLRDRRIGKTAIFSLCFGINLFVFSLWGTRLEAFVLLSGTLLVLTSRAGQIDLWGIAKFSVWGFCLLFGATVLYIYRLAQLSGSWEVAFSRDLTTTTAVSMHMTRFDSLMLVVQDFTSGLHTRVGEDFYNGLIMVIPRALWPDKPSQLLIGQWFRQWYEPNAVNGWTVGGPGEYLVNFGLAGVILGGIVFGVMLTVIHSGYRKMGADQPLSVMLSVVLVLIVVPEGSPIQLLPRVVLWCIPIWLVVWAARMRLRAPVASVPKVPFPGR